MTLPDPVFLDLARRVGTPSLEDLRRVKARQDELALAGRRASLFELVLEARLLPAELERRYLDFASRHGAPGAYPAPSAASPTFPGASSAPAGAAPAFPNAPPASPVTSRPAFPLPGHPPASPGPPPRHPPASPAPPPRHPPASPAPTPRHPPAAPAQPPLAGWSAAPPPAVHDAPTRALPTEPLPARALPTLGLPAHALPAAAFPPGPASSEEAFASGPSCAACRVELADLALMEGTAVEQGGRLLCLPCAGRLGAASPAPPPSRPPSAPPAPPPPTTPHAPSSPPVLSPPPPVSDEREGTRRRSKVAKKLRRFAQSSVDALGSLRPRGRRGADARARASGRLATPSKRGLRAAGDAEPSGPDDGHAGAPKRPFPHLVVAVALLTGALALLAAALVLRSRPGANPEQTLATSEAPPPPTPPPPPRPSPAPAPPTPPLPTPNTPPRGEPGAADLASAEAAEVERISTRVRADLARAHDLLTQGKLAQARAVVDDLLNRKEVSDHPRVWELVQGTNAELQAAESAAREADGDTSPPPPPGARIPTDPAPAPGPPTSPAPTPSPPPRADPEGATPAAGKKKPAAATGDPRLAALVDQVYDQLGAGKVEDADRTIGELEKLSPKDPAVRGVRGIVRYHQRRFSECEDDLAAGLASEPRNDWLRPELAIVQFLHGKYDEARATAGDSTVTECVAVRALIDGPWAPRWPLAHAALEARTATGRYVVATDVGVAPAALDKLEKELAALKPEQRTARVEWWKKSHAALKELGSDLDCAYKAYSKLFKLDKDKDRVTRVFVFDKKEDFARFSEVVKAGGTEHVLGYFLPPYRFLAFYNQAEGKRRGVLYEHTEHVLFHESFHQFLDLYVDFPPRWFDEGLAEYFGLSELKKDGLHYGLVPPEQTSRYTNLCDLAPGKSSRPPHLADLVKLDYASFMQQPGAAYNYALSWGFVHYLGSNKLGRRLLRDYFRGLREGRSQEDLARRVFGDALDEALEKDFWSYVSRMGSASAAPADDD